MENTTVFAGDSRGMVVPRGQYNYVLPRTEELLDTNRVHLIRKPNNATSIREGEDFYDQVRDYLIGSFDPEWSDHASKLEKRVLKRLHRGGHEKVAARLNLLIEFLADDGEKFSIESVLAFATLCSRLDHNTQVLASLAMTKGMLACSGAFLRSIRQRKMILIAEEFSIWSSFHQIG